jgi:hypothetical protein
MANTFIQIASVTVTASTQAEINFTSIPATYTDLCLVLSARTDRSGNPDQVSIQFNGSTTGYSQRTLEGYNNGTSSYTNTFVYAYTNAAGSTSSTFGNCQFYIPNYAGSTNKSVSVESAVENNSALGGEFPAAGLWSNTAAITSIKLYLPSTFNFVQYSTATLYGISKS